MQKDNERAAFCILVKIKIVNMHLLTRLFFGCVSHLERCVALTFLVAVVCIWKSSFIFLCKPHKTSLPQLPAAVALAFNHLILNVNCYELGV